MAGLEAPATPYRLSDFEWATESTSTAWFPAAGIDSIWLLWAWPSFTANVKFWSLSILMQTLSRLRFLCLASNLQFSLVDTDPEISAVKLHLRNCHLPASKPRWIYLLFHYFLDLSLGRCYFIWDREVLSGNLVAKSIAVCQLGLLFRKIIIIRRPINK